MSGVDVLARTLPSLLVIVGALLVLRHWARRGGSTGGTGVRVLTRTGVSKGAVVALVAVGDRRLLVGASEQGVQLITELEPEPTAGTSPAEGSPGDLPDAPELPTVLADTTPGLRRSGTGRWSVALPWSNDRPRMAPIDRLRHLTVRQPVPSRPRGSNVAHHRP